MIENGSFRIFLENLGVIALQEFATSTRVFREVIGASVKAFKKMSSLGLWPHRLLCFAGLRTQKRKSDLY